MPWAWRSESEGGLTVGSLRCKACTTRFFGMSAIPEALSDT